MYAQTERWVLVFWPEEDSTTMVREDHLLEEKCCEVSSDCVIRNLPDHKGKVAAVGMLTVHAYAYVSVHVSET